MAIERGCMYIPMRSGELLLHGGNASPGVQLPIFGSDLNTTTSQAVGPSQMPLMNMDWPRETIPSQNPQLPLSRRNIPKVSRACDACRASRKRCDNSNPCSSCQEGQIECVRIPGLSDRDKAQADILKALRILMDNQRVISKKIDLMQNSTIQTEQATELEKALLGTVSEDEEDDEDVTNPPAFRHIRKYPDVPLFEEEERDPPGEPEVLVGHTTGATGLLFWPAVKNLIGEKCMKHFEHPNMREIKRSLSLYGRGWELCRGHIPDGSPDDRFSDILSSRRSAYSSPNSISDIYLQPEDPRVRVGLSGQLKLDENTIGRLIESYLEHIHIMHPILDPTELQDLVRQPTLRFAAPMIGPQEIGDIRIETSGKKRKRSQASHSCLSEPGRLQRPIDNAILLLVLALGEVCGHRGKIPDVLPNYECIPRSSQHPQSAFSSTVLFSSRSSSQPPPRQSTDANITPETILPRNLSAIPGLAYAASATNILSNEIGGNTLQHVIANILASLYFGQLARPLYSYQFITNASIHLQVILKLKLSQLKAYKPILDNCSTTPQKVPAEYNPLIFAFWTCLQLESDIVTELDLPRSAITTLAIHMPWPNLEAAKDAGTINSLQAESYQAQLYLQSHLNEIYQKVYSIGLVGEPLEEDYKLPTASVQDHFPVIESIVGSIPDINTLAPSMVWSETDLPANEILAARLRAKYYNTEIISYRPFLKMVMNRSSRISNEFNEGSLNNDLSSEYVPLKIIDYARLCIRAMENSTSAFQGIGGGRLIVANVWGTAHAQWGNVILLQAAYQDPILQPFIDKDKLKNLTMQTLKFLYDIADQTSALMTDIKILELTASKIGLLSDYIA